MKNKKTIKDLAPIERPRERLVRYGPEKLSNTELLALLLRSGKKGQNVLALARTVLKRVTTKNIHSVSLRELQTIPGLGPAKASEVVACFELGKRLLKNTTPTPFMEPEHLWNALTHLRNRKKEHVIAIYLDNRLQEVAQETISIGSLTESLVHPREVFEPAVTHCAAHIIVAHNHPSGDPTPSEEDISLTNRLVEAGVILGIEIMDHVIISKNGYFSFKEQGLL